MKVDKNLEKVMNLAIEMKSITYMLLGDKSTIDPDDEGLLNKVFKIDDEVGALMLRIGNAIGDSVYWLSVNEADGDA